MAAPGEQQLGDDRDQHGADDDGLEHVVIA
jgi:hypothetical protein